MTRLDELRRIGTVLSHTKRHTYENSQVQGSRARILALLLEEILGNL